MLRIVAASRLEPFASKPPAREYARSDGTIFSLPCIAGAGQQPAGQASREQVHAF